MGRLSFASWAVGVCLLVFAACSSNDAAPPKPTPGCGSDGDCESGLRCDARVGCVACLFDADCGDGQRCEQGSCATRVACTTSLDCTSGAARACDQALRECFECVASADCKTGQRCEQHACHDYVACANSLDCSSAEVCSDDGACVECAAEADCSAGQTCVAHHCEARCGSDKDCAASGRLCDTDAKHCVECVANSDCPLRYHCSSGSCERDACEEGASRCTEGGAALEICSAPGSAWLKLFCTDQQSCRALGGQAQCASWQCTPGSVRCSVDGRRVETCNADGLGTTLAQACDSGQACLGASCKNVVCQPSATFCRGGDPHSCNADGTASAPISTCADGTYCDDASGSCKPRICSPGQQECVDGQLGTCNATGSAFEDLRACDDGQLCQEGGCVEIVCDPSSYTCDAAGNLRQCSADGTLSTIVASCGGDKFCLVEGATHGCTDEVCTAGQPVCDGHVATTCNSEGSGFESGGTDCSATGKVCVGGACKQTTCEPSTRFCKDGDVWLCTAQGTSSQLFDTCAASEFCDGATSSCKKQVCSADAASCNGTIAAKCNADGSGYLAAGAIDCNATKKVCEAGVCKAKVCTPNALYCKTGDVYRCNESGSSSALEATCSPGSYFCSESGNSASCSFDLCTAGTLGCSGNTLTTCRPDGSGFDLGQDCGAKVCVSGVCTTKVCTPGAYQCAGTTSQVCNALGTGWDTSATCTGDVYCSATSGRCELDVCPGAAKACVNEKWGTCTADGSAVGAAPTDCKLTSKVCTIAGCASSATDTFGDTSQLFGGSSSALFGNIVYVTASRTLTQIQQNYLGLPATARFMVYASDTLAGPYRPVFDVAAAPVTNPVSSGPITVPLSAGKYYFFGSLANPVYFYTQVSPATQFASFGRAIGAYSQYTASVPVSFNFTSSTQLANITLTTVLP